MATLLLCCCRLLWHECFRAQNTLAFPLISERNECRPREFTKPFLFLLNFRFVVDLCGDKIDSARCHLARGLGGRRMGIGVCSFWRKHWLHKLSLSFGRRGVKGGDGGYQLTHLSHSCYRCREGRVTVLNDNLWPVCDKHGTVGLLAGSSCTPLSPGLQEWFMCVLCLPRELWQCAGVGVYYFLCVRRGMYNVGMSARTHAQLDRQIRPVECYVKEL